MPNICAKHIETSFELNVKSKKDKWETMILNSKFQICPVGTIW